MVFAPFSSDMLPKFKVVWAYMPNVNEELFFVPVCVPVPEQQFFSFIAHMRKTSSKYFKSLIICTVPLQKYQSKKE